MGTQVDARVFLGNNGSLDGRVRALHYQWRIVSLRDGLSAFYPGRILLCSAAGLSGSYGRPGQSPRPSRRSIRHVELDRRDRGRPFSGYQWRATRRNGELEYSSDAGRGHPLGERRSAAIRQGVEGGLGRRILRDRGEELEDKAPLGRFFKTTVPTVGMSTPQCSSEKLQTVQEAKCSWAKCFAKALPRRSSLLCAISFHLNPS